jgi:L,D-peptidoglycan transpeptidase YkuD (ErfK/YbiS/YcfS/YnhG family)
VPTPIRSSANSLDLSPRFVDTTTITGSPALAAETIIATLVLPSFGDPTVVQKIYLQGWAAFTVGTSGTAVTLRIRQTNVAGTVIQTTGALTAGIAAAGLVAQDVSGSDATPGVGTYVLTLQVTAGAAVSTVSAVQLLAQIV